MENKNYEMVTMKVNYDTDEILWSSIGHSSAKRAMIAGLKEIIINEKVLEGFLYDLEDDSNWRWEVLKQRRGIKAAVCDRFGEKLGTRMIEEFGEDR